jgi:XTP/dITP diphosphohydrolase
VGGLSWPAWEALRAGPVHALDPDAPQALAVRAAGIDVLPAPGGRGTADLLDGDTADHGADRSTGHRADHGADRRAGHRADHGADRHAGHRADHRARAAAFRDLARGGRTVVWLAGPSGDPDFARALGDLVARDPSGGAELEVVYGSWDPPGARLLDVVAVMDRLRSPGGCPWDAEQTHASLAPYLLEESYEMLDAIEDEDLDLLREELGDVLLQVVFHARLAEEEQDDDRWSIDDVAGDLVAKLVRRHPHVFADRSVTGAAEVETNWDQIKAEEKGRRSVTEGVPLAQPSLALAAKLRRRADRAGIEAAVPSGDDLGGRLFALVDEALAAGLDPEATLRTSARAYRDAILAAEAATADR